MHSGLYMVVVWYVCTYLYVPSKLDCLVASRMAWMHGIVLQIVRVLAILNTIVVCSAISPTYLVLYVYLQTIKYKFLHYLI